MTEPASADRAKAALEAIFALMLPQLAYYVQWEGVVLLATPASPSPAFASALFQGPATFAAPATVNVQLIDAQALAVFGPSFATIPIAIWPDSAGLLCVPVIGSKVRVGFVNADPSKPYIAGVDPLVLPMVSAGVVLRAQLVGLAPSLPAALGVVG